MSNKTGRFEVVNLMGIAGGMLLMAFFTLPMLTFAKSGTIFVDDDASDTQNGSFSHPYKTIKEGLKHAKDGYTVQIKVGTYKENIKIPEDVSVVGESRDKVIIQAKDNDEPVVFMQDDTKISKVTIKGGEDGVKIDNKDSASVSDCVIKDNKRNGVYVKAAAIKDSLKASITDCIIKDNGRNGVFSEARRLVLDDNEIYDNDSDGIGFLGGSDVWLGGNKVTNNGGSGAKMVLDGSTVWSKNNRFADNKREGIEINAYGGSGRIDLKSSKIVKNGRYGIARVIRGNASRAFFSGLTVESSAELWGNDLGNISPIVRVQ